MQYIQSWRIYLHNRLFSYFTLNTIFFHLSIHTLALGPLGTTFFFSFQQEFIHRHWGRCSESIERGNAKSHSAGCSGLGWSFHTEWGTYHNSMGRAVWVHVRSTSVKWSGENLHKETEPVDTAESLSLASLVPSQTPETAILDRQECQQKKRCVIISCRL